MNGYPKGSASVAGGMMDRLAADAGTPRMDVVRGAPAPQ
jgi:hypothetical protein